MSRGIETYEIPRMKASGMLMFFRLVSLRNGLLASHLQPIPYGGSVEESAAEGRFRLGFKGFIIEIDYNFNHKTGRFGHLGHSINIIRTSNSDSLSFENVADSFDDFLRHWSDYAVSQDNLEFSRKKRGKKKSSVSSQDSQESQDSGSSGDSRTRKRFSIGGIPLSPRMSKGGRFSFASPVVDPRGANSDIENSYDKGVCSRMNPRIVVGDFGPITAKENEEYNKWKDPGWKSSRKINEESLISGSRNLVGSLTTRMVDLNQTEAGSPDISPVKNGSERQRISPKKGCFEKGSLTYVGGGDVGRLPNGLRRGSGTSIGSGSGSAKYFLRNVKRVVRSRAGSSVGPAPVDLLEIDFSSVSRDEVDFRFIRKFMMFLSQQCENQSHSGYFAKGNNEIKIKDGGDHIDVKYQYNDQGIRKENKVGFSYKSSDRNGLESIEIFNVDDKQTFYIYVKNGEIYCRSSTQESVSREELLSDSVFGRMMILNEMKGIVEAFGLDDKKKSLSSSPRLGVRGVSYDRLVGISNSKTIEVG